MPDHIHLSLRGNVEYSPEDVALSFMNNIAFAFGQKAIFRPSYYVGTFGEYDMGAVRASSSQTYAPTGQAGGGSTPVKRATKP